MAWAHGIRLCQLPAACMLVHFLCMWQLAHVHSMCMRHSISRTWHLASLFVRAGLGCTMHARARMETSHAHEHALHSSMALPVGSANWDRRCAGCMPTRRRGARSWRMSSVSSQETPTRTPQKRRGYLLLACGPNCPSPDALVAMYREEVCRPRPEPSPATPLVAAAHAMAAMLAACEAGCAAALRAASG